MYFTDRNDKGFELKPVLFDNEDAPHDGAEACHYLPACECDGKLYVISSLNYGWDVRGAVLFTVDPAKPFDEEQPQNH